MLHSQGKPTDLTAMSAWLADTNSLEKVGGNNRLVELVERVTSTASIEQVAKLISDKFLRRQLIKSGNDVIKLGFDKNLSPSKKFDIVFLDPPYELIKASKVFMRLKELRVTKINSLIIYECNRELETIDGLELLRSKKIGKTFLNFFKGFNK